MKLPNYRNQHFLALSVGFFSETVTDRENLLTYWHQRLSAQSIQRKKYIYQNWMKNYSTMYIYLLKIENFGIWALFRNKISNFLWPLLCQNHLSERDFSKDFYLSLLSLSVCRRNDFCALVFVPDVQSF
jgi:hypothetical protein